MKKATSPQSTIEEREPETDLPEGWIEIKLGAAVDSMKNGLYKPSSAYADRGVACLRMYNIEAGRIIWKDIKRMLLSSDEVKEYRLDAGDLLVNRVNSRELVGKTAVVPKGLEACVFESKNIRVRLIHELVNSDFVSYRLLLSGQLHFIFNSQQVVGMASISQPQIADFPLPLPPRVEQERIVFQVQALLAEVEKTRTRLTRVPKILKAFRQSVLAAACSGRLTEDWRNLHSESDAHELLKVILRERKQGSEPVEPERSFIDHVPDGWVITSIDAVTSRITSGSRDWKRYYKEDGPGTFVMAQNVRPLQFDTSYRLAVAPPRLNRDRERSEVRMGDILVTIVGANTGDVCRVPTTVKEHYVCQSVALMRPVMLDTSRFLELYLNSPAHGQAQYRDWIYGEGRPHLSFDHLRATSVMLPPLDEQHEIVRRVEALFKLADKIGERVEAATQRTDKLTQAILAKAFRGELVTTEAELARKEGRTYEPASALLARIKSTRETAAAQNGAKGRNAHAGGK